MVNKANNNYGWWMEHSLNFFTWNAKYYVLMYILLYGTGAYTRQHKNNGSEQGNGRKVKNTRPTNQLKHMVFVRVLSKR